MTDFASKVDSVKNCSNIAVFHGFGFWEIFYFGQVLV